MATAQDNAAPQGIDIQIYVENVQPEDRTLIEEAAKAASVGALRAAYIMVWLACAESLKRRFKEAQPRDNEAGKIVGEFEAMEQRHEAVDRFLLEKALEYGFVANSGHVQLLQVYSNRCIYGHPYEEAPSPEKLIDATATVVDLVLSRPVKLRHGFGNRLLDNLLSIGTFLDDQESAVAVFAIDILPRIDEAVHVWLLDRYLARLEGIAGDASVALFFRRGQWFTKVMLIQVGIDVFSHDEWHEMTIKYPKTIMGICSTASIFAQIGQRAQDTLVGAIIEDSKTHASSLSHLEGLYINGALSQRQRERYESRLEQLSIDEARVSQLDIRLSYHTIVNELKSGNFAAQNSSVDLVRSLGSTQAGLLGEQEQEILGRSILLAAEVNAWRAIAFLRELSADAGNWPIALIRGMLLESFADEEGFMHLYVRHLPLVASAIDQLPDATRNELINAVVGFIEANSDKLQTNTWQIPGVVKSLEVHAWSEPLIRLLSHQAVGD